MFLKISFLCGLFLLIAGCCMADAVLPAGGHHSGGAVRVARLDSTKYLIPDVVFRSALKQQYPNAFVGEYLLTKHPSIVSAVSLIIKGLSIQSLDGIQFFKSLSYLVCNIMPLKTLDLSKNKALTYLDCSYNEISTLNLSKNKNLTTLNCSNNQITDLKLAKKNKVLNSLNCANNQIVSLDVLKNTALTQINCANNPPLMLLDIRRIKKCTTLDITNIPNLSTLRIYTDLKTLDQIKQAKTSRAEHLTISTYWAAEDSHHYKLICPNYNPNTDLCAKK